MYAILKRPGTQRESDTGPAFPLGCVLLDGLERADDDADAIHSGENRHACSGRGCDVTGNFSSGCAKVERRNCEGVRYACSRKSADDHEFVFEVFHLCFGFVTAFVVVVLSI